ncbi:MAG: cell wall-active antibiotics response protein [Bacillota bacterium]
MQRPVVFGGLIVLVGVVLLLNNLGITGVSVGQIFRTYWPVVFIAWGIDTWMGMTGSRRTFLKFVSGFILVLIGVLIIGRNLGVFDFDLHLIWKLFWPVVIMLIGFSLIRGSVSGTGGRFALMGGLEFKRKGWQVRDGNYLAVMGGITMDLSVAEIPDGVTELGLIAIMGGVDVFVPSNITVDCSGTALLGGVTFLDEKEGGLVASARRVWEPDEASPKKIVIKGTAVMGGIEVKQR